MLLGQVWETVQHNSKALPGFQCVSIFQEEALGWLCISRKHISLGKEFYRLEFVLFLLFIPAYTSQPDNGGK